MCKQFCIKQEFTNADSPKQSGVVERALGIIQNAALAACIQAPIIFPLVQLPPTESLWAEAVHWACDALNHTATTTTPETSPRMIFGMGLRHRLRRPVPSSSVLPLEPPLEVVSPGRELFLPRAGYRPPK